MASNPEQLLISAVLRTKDHITPSARGITTQFFHAYPDEWEFIEKYISLHRRTPSRAAFLQKFPEFGIKKTDDVEHFCEETRKNHVQAELSSAIQDVALNIEKGDIDRALRAMHHSALDIGGQMAGMSGDADIIENWSGVYEEVQRRIRNRENMGMAGIPTGFPTLDERTGGPQPGHVWVVAARLGQGKTLSLVRMGCAAAFSGYTVQYDALEQSIAEISMRVHTFASSEYGKNTFKNLDLMTGNNLSSREYKEFLQSLKDYVPGKLHIADTSKGPVGPLTLSAQIERNKPHILFLDYLTLLDSSDTGDDWKGIARLSKQIKTIAGQYQIPIVAAAQLNRSAANRSGNLAGPEALAESDAIGRDADAVITMQQISRHVVKMKLAKYRHGRDGYTWYTRFLPNTGHFEEISYDDAMDQKSDDDTEEEAETTEFTPRQKGSFKQIAERRKEKSAAGKKVVMRKKKS